MRNYFEARLQIHFQKQLRRPLTEKEKDFICWMAKESEKRRHHDYGGEGVQYRNEKYSICT